MKAEFSREEIVTRSYSMSLSRFMQQVFREAHIDYWGTYGGDRWISICIASGTKEGYLDVVYRFLLKDDELDLDFNDKKNVKSVLSRYLKEKQDEKDSFSI